MMMIIIYYHFVSRILPQLFWRILNLAEGNRPEKKKRWRERETLLNWHCIFVFLVHRKKHTLVRCWSVCLSAFANKQPLLAIWSRRGQTTVFRPPPPPPPPLPSLPLPLLSSPAEVPFYCLSVCLATFVCCAWSKTWNEKEKEEKMTTFSSSIVSLSLAVTLNYQVLKNWSLGWALIFGYSPSFCVFWKWRALLKRQKTFLPELWRKKLHHHQQ